jgi:hypothetical protein
MAAFLRLVTGSPGNNTSPPVHDDDVVYPLHMLDDTKTLRNIVVAWTLRFDDVLDVEKLHHSLSRLLEIDDWRMLGGRLRLKVTSSPIDPCKSMAADCSQTGQWKARGTRPSDIHRGPARGVLHSRNVSNFH